MNLDQPFDMVQRDADTYSAIMEIMDEERFV